MFVDELIQNEGERGLFSLVSDLFTGFGSRPGTDLAREDPEVHADLSDMDMADLDMSEVDVALGLEGVTTAPLTSAPPSHVLSPVPMHRSAASAEWHEQTAPVDSSLSAKSDLPNMSGSMSSHELIDLYDDVSQQQPPQQPQKHGRFASAMDYVSTGFMVGVGVLLLAAGGVGVLALRKRVL